jgi:hypothetical protein
MSRTNPYTITHSSASYPHYGAGSLEASRDRRDRHRLIAALQQAPIQQAVPQPTEYYYPEVQQQNFEETAEGAAALGALVVTVVALVVEYPIVRIITGGVCIWLGFESFGWIAWLLGFALIAWGVFSLNRRRLTRATRPG